ncbi:MAG: hypothetical protein ACP5I6_05885 [Caldisphaera sp.]
MSLELRTYKLALRKTNKGPVILFKSSAPKQREYTLIRIGGKKTEEIFNSLVSALKEENLIEEESKSNNYNAYKLKESIGASVGGYLILIRRSREPTSWIPYFKDFIKGEKYKGSREVLSYLLGLSMDISKLSSPPENNRIDLDPKVLNAVSAGTKIISKKLWGIKK